MRTIIALFLFAAPFTAAAAGSAASAPTAAQINKAEPSFKQLPALSPKAYAKLQAGLAGRTEVALRGAKNGTYKIGYVENKLGPKGEQRVTIIDATEGGRPEDHIAIRVGTVKAE